MGRRHFVIWDQMTKVSWVRIPPSLKKWRSG